MKTLAFSTLIFLFVLFFSGCSGDRVTLEYYYSSHCPSCDKVLPVLRVLSRQWCYRVKTINVLTDRELDHFLSRLNQAALSDHPGRLPMLFMDDEVYTGTEEILSVLQTLEN
ncbi:MAG: thioredoxin family protein [Spirochaetales bacterium]|nr:thioredoxin family protein [Spirochaetales bacterium]